MKEAKEKEAQQFADYLKLREDRVQKKNVTNDILKNIVCNEKNHLNRSGYEKPA